MIHLLIEPLTESQRQCVEGMAYHDGCNSHMCDEYPIRTVILNSCPKTIQSDNEIQFKDFKTQKAPTSFWKGI